MEFLTRLQVQNRIQVPVDVRQRFKLEPGEILRTSVKPAERYDNEIFYAKLKPDGRITIPWQVVWALEIKPGEMLRIKLCAEEQV